MSGGEKMKIHAIVVAKSRKNNGYCLVIYDIDNNCFRRLISNNPFRQDKELLYYECLYANNREIRLKDELYAYIDGRNTGDLIQPENFYLDINRNFEFIKRLKSQEIKKIIKKHIDTTDYIFEDCFNKLSSKPLLTKSFLICEVENLRFYTISKQREDFSTYDKCECDFTYKGIKYNNFSVTIKGSRHDDIEKYSGNSYKKALVGFSIGHQYNGYHYKFLCSFLGRAKEEENE